MAAVIGFEQVSKRYRIGAGRTSLREAIATLPRRVAGIDRALARDPNDLWALRDVSFELQRGDALGIIGANGAGKTTALKLLSGITRPTHGRVTIAGRVGALIELGAGFHPDLTGRDNVYLNATILGLRRREVDRLLDRIVAFSELSQFMDTPVKRYSSGMYARLAFAVAAHVHADVLLVDEVLSVGDTAFQAKCVARMKEIQKQGTTIVFVSHNLMAVGGLCQKGLLLNRGRVQVAGSADEAIRAYAEGVRAGAHADLKHKVTGRVQATGHGVDITEVVLLGDDGRPRDVFLMGEPLTIRVGYHARHRIERPVFAIGLVRADGLNCCAGTSRLSGMDIESIEGPGIVEVKFDEVNVIPGVYQVNTLIWDHEMIRPHVSAMSQVLRVDSATPHIGSNYGVFVPHLTWSMLPNPSLEDRHGLVANVAADKR